MKLPHLERLNESIEFLGTPLTEEQAATLSTDEVNTVARLINQLRGPLWQLSQYLQVARERVQDCEPHAQT